MMNWYKNMKIKAKLILGFTIAIVFTLLLAIVGIKTASSIDSDYSYILEYPQRRMDALAGVNLHANKVRRLVASMGLYTGNMTRIEELKKELESEIALANAEVDKFINNINTDPRRSAEDKQTGIAGIQELYSMLQNYQTQIADATYRAALANNVTLAQETINSGAESITQLSEKADSLWQVASDYVDELSAACTVDSQKSIFLNIVLSVVSTLLLMIISFIIASMISNPIKKLVSIAEDVAKGKLDVNNIPETKDEIGILVKNFFIVINVVKSLVDDLSGMGRLHTAGDMDARVDENKYHGSYRDVVVEVNQMVGDHIDLILLFMNKIAELVDGNFEVTLEQQPGKKAIMNENLNNLRTSIKGINNEIVNIVRNVSEGKTDASINESKYHGDWVTLMAGLNQVLQSYGAPINEMLSVLQQIADGNFKEMMKGSYKGDFNAIKSAVNNMVSNTASYISEISNVLDALSSDDFDQDITREYVGEFSKIKDAINNIIDKFNRIIADIYTAADQVNVGAKQISESSMKLAQGASEQASAVEELNATIMTINESTTKNAEEAKNASDLAIASKDNAQKGNQDMHNMLASMDDINNSSNNIAKIIKVIDDIAFQTNLLALNAAVEAARAGEHGKGFAVVAEEVRNLAGRSQRSAKETSDLIEESVNQVNIGTQIAGTTAEALNSIMEGVTAVSKIIIEIARASGEQADAISQLTTGIMQITDVVQSNSATSEEAAAASQELSSQAEVLKNLISVFKLKA